MTLPAPIGCPLSVEPHCCTPMEKRSMIPFRSMTGRGAPWPRSIEFPFSHSLPRMRIGRRESKRERGTREIEGWDPKGGRILLPFFLSFFSSSIKPFPDTRGVPDSRDKQSALRCDGTYSPFVRKGGRPVFFSHRRA